MHCCNDIGGFGRGFVVSLSEKYPETKIAYKELFNKGLVLGDTQFIQVASDICIGNMIAQHDIKWQGKIPPIRYEALKKCLKTVYDKALSDNFSVSSPRFGCVLAGGEWSIIEKIIKEAMTVETYVYTLEKQKDRWATVYE
jgi:hypothetical protein